MPTAADASEALECIARGLRSGGEKELRVGVNRLRRINPVDVFNPWSVFFELLEHLAGPRAVGLDLTSKEMLSELIRRFLIAHWLKHDSLVVDAVHKKAALQLCRRLVATAEANAEAAPTGTIVFNIAASQLILEQLQSATPVPVGALCAKVAKAILTLSVTSLLGAVAETALEVVDIGALLASKERIDTLVAAEALALVADRGQAVLALGTMLREHRDGKWLEMWAITDALASVCLASSPVTQLSLMGTSTGSKHTLTLFNLAHFDDWWFEPAWRIRERAVRALISIRYTASQRGDGTVSGAAQQLIALCAATESHALVQRALQEHGCTTDYIDVLQRQWSCESIAPGARPTSAQAVAAVGATTAAAAAEPARDMVVELRREMSERLEHTALTEVRAALNAKMCEAREGAQRIREAIASIPGCSPALLSAAVQKERMVEAIRLALLSSPTASPLDTVADDVRSQLHQIAFDALCLVAKQIPEAVRAAKVNISACRALELEVTTMTKALYKLSTKGEGLPSDSGRAFAEALTVYLSALAFVRGQNDDGLVSQALGGVETVPALQQVRERLKSSRLALGLHPDLGADWDTDSTIDRFAPAASRVHSPADTPAASPTASRRSARSSEAWRRAPWQLDYDLLIFETNKRGHRKAPMGRGSFGDVYKAQLQGRAVAVKVLRDEVKTCRDQFFMEVELAHRLRHTNIVDILGGTCPQVTSNGTAPGKLALDDAEYTIVMEFVEGPTLAELVAQGPDAITDAQRLSITRQLASALSYLHCTRPKIVHRDLKPANILMTHDLTPKICDFGLAMTKQSTVISSTRSELLREADVASRQCNVRGFTEYYAAPELLSGRKRDDPRSDIFSLGLVLYELWTGLPCWPREAKPSPADAIVRGDRPDFKTARSVPPIVRRLIERCWAEKTSNRPQAVDLLSLLMLPAEDLLAAVDSGRFARVGPLLPEWLKQRDEADGSTALDEDWGIGGGIASDPLKTFTRIRATVNAGTESLNASHWNAFHCALRATMFSSTPRALECVAEACDILAQPAFSPGLECTVADVEVVVPFLGWAIRSVAAASANGAPTGPSAVATRLAAATNLLEVLPGWARLPYWGEGSPRSRQRLVPDLMEIAKVVDTQPSAHGHILLAIANLAATGQHVLDCSGGQVRKLAVTTLNAATALPAESFAEVTEAVATLLKTTPESRLAHWVSRSFRVALLHALATDKGVGAVTCVRVLIQRLPPANRGFVAAHDLQRVVLRMWCTLPPHDPKWDALTAMIRDTTVGLSEFAHVPNLVAMTSAVISWPAGEGTKQTVGLRLIAHLLATVSAADDSAMRCFEMSRAMWMGSELIGASMEIFGAAMRCQTAPGALLPSFAAMAHGLRTQVPRSIITACATATSCPWFPPGQYAPFVAACLPAVVGALETLQHDAALRADDCDAIARLLSRAALPELQSMRNCAPFWAWVQFAVRSEVTSLPTLVDVVNILQCIQESGLEIDLTFSSEALADELTSACQRRDYPVPQAIATWLVTVSRPEV